jgi:hypothetical protein
MVAVVMIDARQWNEKKANNIHAKERIQTFGWLVSQQKNNGKSE